MKKVTIIAFLTLITLQNSIAQSCQVINGDMENWTETIFPPDGFFRTDSATLQTPGLWFDIPNTFSAIFGGQPNVSRTDDAYAGDSAMKVTTVSVDDGALVFHKFSCGQRPSSFKFAWKHVGASLTDQDTIAVAAVLANSFSYSSVDNTFILDTVGSSGYVYHEAVGEVASYQSFDLPFIYHNASVSDSLVVMVYVANTSGASGEAFFDELSFEYDPLSTTDELQNEISIYPNPTTDIINIGVNGYEVNKITVFNLAHKEVFSSRGQIERIDLSGLASGVYILSVDINGYKYNYQLFKN